MNLKNKFAVLAGSALIVGGLLTGAAFAATASPEVAAERAAKIEQAVAAGTITQEQADKILSGEARLEMGGKGGKRGGGFMGEKAPKATNYAIREAAPQTQGCSLLL